MKFSYQMSDLIELLSPLNVVGQCGDILTGISSLLESKLGDISFLGNSKYAKDVTKCNASVIFLPRNYNGVPLENQTYMFFDNPSLALAELCRDIEKQQYDHDLVGKVHDSAIIDGSAKIGSSATICANVVIGKNVIIGDNSVIGAGCYIGNNVSIGTNTVLHPNITIMQDSIIGNNCLLYSGVVIGSDGFGYENVNGNIVKVPQIGNVVIEDDVEIGANTTIDRARFGHTIIGRGTKIDNLVQIGHNVIIGRNCIIVSQTGIAGSTTIGNYVTIGGQVGVAGHLTIGDGSMVAGKSSVPSSCKPGSVLRGVPCMPYNMANKYYVFRKKIPELFKRVSVLEDAVLSGDNTKKE